MSTSAEATQNLPNPVRPQPTPVIIKVGGGEGFAPEADTQRIRIESLFMPFVDPTGEPWNEARSTVPGRIKVLTLQDGALPTLYSEVLPQPNALTSLQLSFDTPGGKEVFTVSEVMVDDKVFLNITSPSVPFSVVERSLTGEGWSESEATYTGRATLAVFQQKLMNSTDNNMMSLRYTFSSKVCSMSLDFHP
jgi:hypothetical protein